MARAVLLARAVLARAVLRAVLPALLAQAALLGASASAGAPDGGTVELALGEAALTGLLSWLEAAPPGSHLDVAL